MLALIYLFVMLLLGDSICRRFYSFASIPHRFAAAFLSGLLISSWWTYLAAWLFSGSSSPLLWGNLVYFITAIGLIFWLRRRPNSELPADFDRGATEFKKWDWVVVGIFVVYACWLMFATFDMSGGKILVATHQWSDFGSTLSIMQTFANGHNFPTEYPHFSGDRIRYHFLFYFQAGNLEYLGLNPTWSNNILSIVSLVTMLILVMTLGVVMFGSRVVGRIGAGLFFFHGTLSFIPYVYAQGSVSNAIASILKMKDFLPSGFNYRGELWGVWSQVVYANQRHLASSVGIFLLVLIFVVIRYRNVPARIRVVKPVAPREPEILAGETDDSPDGETSMSDSDSAADESEMSESDAPLESSIPNASIETAASDAAGSGDLPEDQALASVTDEPPEKTEAAEKSDQQEPQELSISEPSISESETSIDDAESEDAGHESEPENGDTAAEERGSDEGKPLDDLIVAPEPPTPWYMGLSPYIFSGLLLGLLPLWNGAVFTAAFGVFAVMFVLFPLRRQMVVFALSTAVVSLPQIYYLKEGMREAGFSMLHWGYTLNDPTILKAFSYLGFTFGFKWLLIAVAIVVGSLFHLRMMIAISSLIIVTFCFQFSPEALTNHKFLNIWLILANLFAASGLWYLWNLRILRTAIPARILAGVLAATIVVGGVIDIFPIRNAFWMEMPYTDDPLVRWVTENTDPKAIFLSHRFVNHRILLAGRRLFYGHPYYAWGAGYPTFERDEVYKKMFESRDAAEVFRLLKQNNISYVAFDNAVRKSDFIKKPNEMIYQAYFQTVFEDTENRYDALKIYAVPAELGAPNPSIQLPADAQSPNVSGEAAGGAFVGGEGTAGGRFSKPRGIAVDTKGFFYVADTGNSRIQKFDADGKFVSAIGTVGDGEGELRGPNGVAVDAAGNIYVVDASSHKLVRFGPDGKYVKEWKGPEPGFYGPRDVAVGPDKKVYIVDQGRTRIVKFDPGSEVFTSWGTSGSGEGQFLESTGIAIGGGFVFVADLGNNRIQVFDLDGKFVRQWEVPVWERYPWHYPDAVFDEQTNRLYVTNGWKNQILAFDIDGNAFNAGLQPDILEKLDNPTSLSILTANKTRRLLVLNTGGSKVSVFELENSKTK